MINTTELESLLQILKKYPNIKTFRSNGLELEFGPSQLDAPNMFPATSLKDGMPGDDEMLLYSTESFEELQAQRNEGA